MTFAKQCYICFHIQNGIKFFGTNPDKYTSIGGYKVPGCGSILASI
jgi:ribonucleotide monophosphatase NagD (HAD superfamily)